MTLVAVNFTGGTFKHKSLPVSAQSTVNLLPQKIDNAQVKDLYILDNFVGQKLFGSVKGISRGMTKFKNLIYRVVANSLYSVNSEGVHTLIGSIPGNDRCVFDHLVNDLIIVADRKVFIYNGSSLTQVTDPDLQSPDSVAVLNNQAIYDGDEDLFGVSDVGQPAVINGLNYAAAESKGDNLIRVFAFEQNIYMFGEETIELWWNSGVGKPPFDRVQGAIIPVGIAGIHAATSNNNQIYFLGSDRELYALKGTSKASVTPTAIIREFQSYSTVEDTICWSMKLKGINLIAVVFPTANKSWVYVEGGDWFQWSSGVNGERNKANSYVKIYNKHLVEDYSNGNIYSLNFDSHTENGDTITRQRDSALIDGDSLGGSGRNFTINKFILNMDVGNGTLTGQGQDPEVMLSLSGDGGKTFKSEKRKKIGKLGEFNKRVEFNNLGTFNSLVVRIKITDPVSFTLKNAFVDFELGTL